MKSPVLPESSPFSADQRNWLNGFFAGLANTASFGNGGLEAGGQSLQPFSPNKEAAQSAPAKPVLILFGSQSGTAEGLAHALGDKLKSLGNPNGLTPRFQPKVLGMDQFRDIDLASETTLLMITSTWGDGEMPDNAVAFWNFLKGAEAPALPMLNFSVLGLGDKNYARFCQAGKNLDQRLVDLGAKRLLPLWECDTDYEAKSENWMQEITQSLSGTLETDAGEPLAGQTKVAAATTSSSAYSRKNPFLAPILENRLLNGPGSSKDTRHFSLSLLGSGLEYKVGDALGILPRNCHELVEQILATLKFQGNEKVILEGGEAIALRPALISKLDLRRGTDKLLANLRQICIHPDEQGRLDELLLDDAAKARPYLAERDVLDVLEDFPLTRLDAQQFSVSLAKIAPRLYSISSSPNQNPGEVHLTVAVVRYSLAGRRRLGVASSFLAERLPLGMTVPVFIQPTAHFTPPKEPGLPIIMVGPGTGVAPFRAFLQERQYQKDPGQNWLFFGDQHSKSDYLYREELTAMEDSGFLTRLDLAFSRDQEEKVYVQTRMLEQSKVLFSWLESGAYFYVCGDAKRMAKDVEEALLLVIAKESGKGATEAQVYLENMKTQKRYQRDVY